MKFNSQLMSDIDPDKFWFGWTAGTMLASVLYGPSWLTLILIFCTFALMFQFDDDVEIKKKK